MSIIYENVESKGESGKTVGSKVFVEKFLENKFSSHIEKSIPERDCPVGKKKIVVIYIYNKIVYVSETKLLEFPSQLTGSIIPQPGIPHRAWGSDWDYILTWKVEIHCIGINSSIGEEEDNSSGTTGGASGTTGGTGSGENCGSQGIKTFYADGICSVDTTLTEANNKARTRAIENIFRQLNAFVNSKICPNECFVKTYSYWIGEASYNEIPLPNNTFMSTAIIEYKFEVFCLPDGVGLKEIVFNENEQEH